MVDVFSRVLDKFNNVRVDTRIVVFFIKVGGRIVISFSSSGCLLFLTPNLKAAHFRKASDKLNCTKFFFYFFILDTTTLFQSA